MFTIEQIKEKLLKLKTGADFPVLAMDLRNIGVTYYETKMEDGRSVYHGQNGYELTGVPTYDAIEVADIINLEQLKLDIASHQKGKSDYFQISRQCASNGVDKWAVCLVSMTCTYVDKAGNKVWVEHIPDTTEPNSLFTVDQIKTAHSKVKTGADFPAYIREIKALGVTHYETYVTDGRIDYYVDNYHTVKMSAKYPTQEVANITDSERFKTELKLHQEGRTDFLTFIKMCAIVGIAKWQIYMDKMTCTYYDKAGNEVLVEGIPQ